MRAAIAQLETVPESNPRSQEALRQITSLSRQIELLEDSPFLQRANDLASTGDPNSLDASLLKLLGSVEVGRFTGKTQTKIQAWIERRQRLVDQPFLDRAQQLSGGRQIWRGQLRRPGRIRSGTGAL